MEKFSDESLIPSSMFPCSQQCPVRLGLEVVSRELDISLSYYCDRKRRSEVQRNWLDCL